MSMEQASPKLLYGNRKGEIQKIVEGCADDPRLFYYLADYGIFV